MTKKQEAQNIYSQYRPDELDDDLNGVIEVQGNKWQMGVMVPCGI